MQKPISVRFNYISIISLYIGMLNAYAYYNYNGFLISMQSGNLIRLGIFLYELDFALLFTTFSIILGCLIGIILMHFINYYYYKNKSLNTYKNFCLILNIILLSLFSIFAPIFSDNIALFLLALISSIHLYNVHNYYYAIHGICGVTNNVKNLGIFIGDAIILHKRRYILITLKYFLLFILFSLGSFLGSLLSNYLQYNAIYIMILILIFLLIFSNKSHQYNNDTNIT